MKFSYKNILIFFIGFVPVVKWRPLEHFGHHLNKSNYTITQKSTKFEHMRMKIIILLILIKYQIRNLQKWYGHLIKNIIIYFNYIFQIKEFCLHQLKVIYNLTKLLFPTTIIQNNINEWNDNNRILLIKYLLFLLTNNLIM